MLEAADGVAAVELARSWRPEAVVTDVLMPRMDGFHVCRSLRAEPDLRDAWIVLAPSAFVGEEDRELARRAGADARPRGDDRADAPRALRRQRLPALPARRSDPAGGVGSPRFADVFHARTSDRVYRPRMQVRRAVAIMLEVRGTHLDPSLLDALIASLDAMVAISERPEAALP